MKSFDNKKSFSTRRFDSNPSDYLYEIAVSVVVYKTDPEELSIVLNSIQYDRGIIITVIDNSPTPTLRSTAEEGGARYIFLGKNIGFGAGHNIAIRSSIDSSRYHAIINPDIVLEPGTLTTLVDFMDKYPQVGQAMPAVFYPDGSEQHLAKRLPTPADLFIRRFLGPLGKKIAKGQWQRYEMRDLDLSIAREVPCLSGCFMFLRTSVLKDVGLFDERYFMYLEDIDFCRRVGEVSLTVICPTAKVQHNYGKGSYKSLHLLLLHIVSAARYFFKWGWFFDRKRRQHNRQTTPLYKID